jgi:hypothetical protein
MALSADTNARALPYAIGGTYMVFPTHPLEATEGAVILNSEF